MTGTKEITKSTYSFRHRCLFSSLALVNNRSVIYSLPVF